MKFHERFNITVGEEAARRRFVNRALNTIFGQFLAENDPYQSTTIEILTELGERNEGRALGSYLKGNFLRTLEAIEGFYRIGVGVRAELDSMVTRLLDSAELDLGVRWANDSFLPTGAKLLDDVLVNDALAWLRDRRYDSVLPPFEKALQHLLRGRREPQLLADVITDMYEALEALAMLVTERSGEDLSANRELFLSRIKAPEAYKAILKAYIEYANEFRHGAPGRTPRPPASYGEAETFVYLTGVFIRFCSNAL